MLRLLSTISNISQKKKKKSKKKKKKRIKNNMCQVSATVDEKVKKY